jgi:hypothetical protein
MNWNPKTREEAFILIKKYGYKHVPTKLEPPFPPPDDLPPDEKQKAEEEYERAMKQYVIESTYGANYEENPLWQYDKRYFEGRWEVTKNLWL